MDTLHPKTLVILTSSNSVPSTIPVSHLVTSTPRMAVGDIPADSNPLFSNRGRVMTDDIQARIAAYRHPEQSNEIPVLQPPYLIQGISASLMCLAEIRGIHATCYILSSWNQNPEGRDVEKLVAKVRDELCGVELNVDDVLNGWKMAVGIFGAEKMSVYL